MESGCEHLPAQGCYKCCSRCNYDTHACPGCGEDLTHGVEICVDCTDELSACAQGENRLNIELYQQMADAISQLSECRRSKVGAVLVDARNGEVLGTGHHDGSGCGTLCKRGAFSHDELPAGSPHDSPETACTRRHAEIEALADAGAAGKSSDNALMIVNHQVCSICAATLAGLGVAFLEVEPLT